MRRPLLAAVALAACGHSAHPAVPAASTVDAARLEAQLTPFVQAHGAHWGETHALSGFVLVAQHDRTIYQHAFGFADREQKLVADADTSFRIGSVTKQFTAVAILMLQHDGKLHTSDPIKTYLPDYPAVGANITLHQLLTHTSGIPDYTEMPSFDMSRDQPETVAQLLASFDDKTLLFPPGSQWRYSNSNYIVLGAIVEKLSGMSYADFLAKRVFGPAGMTHTVVGDADGAPDRALGYAPDGDHLAPAHKIDMTVPFAAGAIRSSASDLVRWNRALAGDTLLDEASKREMYTVDRNGYAYGWFIDQVDGHQVIGHPGGIDGFITDYRRIPDLDLVVVAWSNNGDFDASVIGKAAVRAALGETISYVEPVATPLDAAAAARCSGNWKMDDASRTAALGAGLPPEVLDAVATATTAVADGKLVLTPVGQPGTPLDSGGPDTYFLIDRDLILQFTLPVGDGAASALVIHQGQLDLHYDRVGGQ